MDAVDQTRVKCGAEKFAATLDHHTGAAAAPEIMQDVAERLGAVHERAAAMLVIENARAFREMPVACDHDAKWLLLLKARNAANGEQRIIGPQGAGAN